jgi:benzodiazapine receptor
MKNTLLQDPADAASSSPSAPTRQQAVGLIGWLALCFAATATSLFVTTDGWFETLKKPAWNPPSWLFGPVWTLLYAMMAVAAWLVWRDGGWKINRWALGVFCLQLLFNVLWTPLFFGAHRPGLAFIDIVLLWSSLAVTIVLFWRVNTLAGMLLLPYLAWTTFAAVLNATIWRMNT